MLLSCAKCGKSLSVNDFFCRPNGGSQVFHSACGIRKGASNNRSTMGLDADSIPYSENKFESRPDVIDCANLYVNQTGSEPD